MQPDMTEYEAGRLKGHGNDYQRLLAWGILQRLMFEDRDFQLAFEMTAAKKFDDIGVFLNGKWNLIQTKHVDATKDENKKKLTKTMLFDKFDKKDNTGNKPFNLVMYYNAFKSIEANWKHGDVDKLIIFTKKEFDYESDFYRDIVKVDHVLKFSKGRHIQLVNQEEEFVELLKFYKQKIDRDMIKKFFSKLVLAVGQPNVEELRQELIHDGRVWMQTWIQPDDLGRMGERFWEIPLSIIEKLFNEYEKPKMKRNADGRLVNKKEFMDREYANNILEHIKEQIRLEITKCSTRSCASLEAISHYYINRTISFSTEKQFETLDNEFVKQIYAAHSNQNCFVFVAPPGMGKSTLLQYLAFEVQKEYEDKVVFLLYLNNFVDEMPMIEDIHDILNLKIFKSELSIENVKLLVEDNDKQIVIFFDAFDELSELNTKRVLKLFDILLIKSNIKLIISGRMQVQEKLSTHLNAVFVQLRPFDNENQMRFLKKFWQVKDADMNKFKIFAKNVLDIFNTDLTHQEQDFVGVPLMTRMAAEIYAEPFEKFASSNDSLVPPIAKESFSVVDFFETFVQKSIQILINKEINMDNSSQLDSLSSIIRDEIIRDYQVFAADKIFNRHKFLRFTANKAYYERLNFLDKTFRHLQSLLFETSRNFPRFTHRLFLEYFTAKYLYEIFGEAKEWLWQNRILKELRQNENVRHFFLTMVDSEVSGGHLGPSTKNRLKLLAQLGKPVIVWSCQRDYSNLIKQLYNEQIAFENIRDDKGNPLLQVTFESGSHKVDTFLKKIVITYKYPLHNAVESNRLDVVNQVLNEQNINSIDDNGNSPILLVKSVEIFTCLLKSGASLAVRNKDGEAVLNKFIKNGRDELVETLFTVKDTSGFDISSYIDLPDKDGQAPLHIASADGNIKLVKLLIEKGKAKVDLKIKEGQTALDLAIQNGHIEVVRYLVKKCNAVKTEHFLHITECLEKVGEFMRKDPETVFIMVDACLEIGKDINSRDQYGYSAIHRIAEHDGLELLELLVSRSYTIDFNAQSGLGQTPLHVAFNFESYNVADFLISQDIDLSLTTSDGENVLHFAVTKKDNKCVDKLIQKYQNSSRSLDEVDRRGETALYKAAKWENEENVRLLLEAGASVSNIDVTKLIEHWSSNKYRTSRSAPTIFQCLLDKIDHSLLKDVTFLLHAVRLGCEKLIKKFIDAGVNVDCRDMFGRTPLHIAVRNDHPEVVKHLIAGKADVNYLDLNGRTPLHFCRQAEISRLLIAAGANVNLKDSDENSVLHQAARNNCSELAEFFIEKNPNEINCKNKCGKTALHIAVETDNAVIVELLVNSKADINAVDNGGNTPIFYVNYDRFNSVYRKVTVETLLNKGASVDVLDKQRRNLLHIAAMSLNSPVPYDAIKVLINAGLDVNAQDEHGNIPLHYACREQKKCFIVGYLIEFDSEINLKNANGETPLHLASKNNDSVEIINLLYVKKAVLTLADNNGNTPLHLAILHKKANTALRLIDLLDRHSLSAQNNDEETALHLAVLKNNFHVVKKLIERGVNLHLKTESGKTALDLAEEQRHHNMVNLKNAKGETPLHLASKNDCSYDMINLLLANKADLTLADNNGNTPLHLAILHNNTKNALRLIDLLDSPSLNARNNDEETALHVAVLKNNFPVVMKLIERAVNLHLKTESDETALDLAEEQRHHNMVKYLREKMNPSTLQFAQV